MIKQPNKTASSVNVNKQDMTSRYYHR